MLCGGCNLFWLSCPSLENKIIFVIAVYNYLKDHFEFYSARFRNSCEQRLESGHQLLAKITCPKEKKMVPLAMEPMPLPQIQQSINIWRDSESPLLGTAILANHMICVTRLQYGLKVESHRRGFGQKSKGVRCKTLLYKARATWLVI